MKSHYTHKVVSVDILISRSPLCETHIYYTVKVKNSRNLRLLEHKKFLSAPTGRVNCSSLLYALTQDDVLEAVSPVKGVIR